MPDEDDVLPEMRASSGVSVSSLTRQRDDAITALAPGCLFIDEDVELDDDYLERLVGVPGAARGGTGGRTRTGRWPRHSASERRRDRRHRRPGRKHTPDIIQPPTRLSVHTHP